MNTSPVAQRIAAEIAPDLQAQAREHRTEIVDALGFPARQTAALWFPPLVRSVPILAESGADMLLTRYGQKSLETLISDLMAHMQAKRLNPHPSIKGFR